MGTSTPFYRCLHVARQHTNILNTFKQACSFNLMTASTSRVHSCQKRLTEIVYNKIQENCNAANWSFLLVSVTSRISLQCCLYCGAAEFWQYRICWIHCQVCSLSPASCCIQDHSLSFIDSAIRCTVASFTRHLSIPSSENRRVSNTSLK